jgi:hypothetical protein
VNRQQRSWQFRANVLLLVAELSAAIFVVAAAIRLDVATSCC